MKHRKIIAVDFDGTLFTDGYPGVGRPIYETIGRLMSEQEAGSRIILWTNRSDGPLRTAIEACAEIGIHFDAINDNLPEIIEYFGTNPRKVFANEYWDDRTIHMSHLRHPDHKDMHGE